MMTSSQWPSVSSLSNMNLRILELEMRRWSLATPRPNCTPGSHWVSLWKPASHLSTLNTLLIMIVQRIYSLLLPVSRLLCPVATYQVLATSSQLEVACKSGSYWPRQVSKIHFIVNENPRGRGMKGRHGLIFEQVLLLFSQTSERWP